MTMDAHTRGRAWLAHLTQPDRDLLLAASGARGADTSAAPDPAEVESLLAQPALFERVFGAAGEHDEERGGELSNVSPFLTFAVAIHRAEVELAQSPYIPEWTGPRQRLPVFAAEELRDFLADPIHRLFLAELLASYTRVHSGSVVVRRKGVKVRQRFNDMDLTGLARLVDVVDDAERPGLYRRLGDLSLLLTGVFPDHTARNRFAPIEVERLARALDPANSVSSEQLFEALASHGAVGLLEQLGQRWYRLALATVTVRTSHLDTLESVRERFVDARRVLNLLTDRYLFPFRARWFPSAN